VSGNRPIRLVLDTNVYVAASSPKSFIDTFIFASKTSINPYTIYISPQILVEVQGKLVERMKYTQADAVAFLRSVQAVSEVVYPKQQIKVVKRDPDDNKILECAIEAAADMIITADKDLLDLKSYESIAIVHPSQLKYIFADIFG
jgi:putative PIN family toxin of toxin-antitoxin system